jgi:hypothetical protein
MVIFHCVWANGSLGMGQTENLAQKCGIFLFFHKTEGIRGLYTGKQHIYAICTWVNSVWQHKYCFLDDFDEREWDLGLQDREWTRPSHKYKCSVAICGNITVDPPLQPSTKFMIS